MGVQGLPRALSPDRLLTLNAALVAAALLLACGRPHPPEPYVTLTASDGRPVDVHVEIASTDEQRQRGLTGRQPLSDGEGMIFVFPESQDWNFWMKDTPVPLSLACISEELRVVGLIDLQPLSLEFRHPGVPYRYAVEAPQGFFQRNGVTLGSAVEPHLGAR